eukprot:m.56566 g.56566  ORF g.56566 m.56566 type:complete len:93 (-) comp11566_c0_seq6:144-422(-)
MMNCTFTHTHTTGQRTFALFAVDGVMILLIAESCFCVFRFQEVNSFIKRLGLPSDTDLDTISLDSLSEAEALTLNIMRIKAAHMKTIAISLS